MAGKKTEIRSNIGKVLVSLKGARQKMPRLIRANLNTAAWLIVGRAQRHYLSGESLNVQSGVGRSALTVGKSRVAGKTYKQEISLAQRAWYLAAWEEGFRVPSYTKTSSNKVLKFLVDGKTVFTKKRRARTEAPRKWFEPAVEDMTPKIVELFESIGTRFI